MHPLFSLDSLVSLLTLIVLEIVLGIDNVIFVSILIGRLPSRQQLAARRVWMIAGILIRSGLLLGLGWLVTSGNTHTIFGGGVRFQHAQPDHDGRRAFPAVQDGKGDT